MARQSNYDCDGCGRSVHDPGVIGALEISTYGLRDGSKYIDDAYEHETLDLCPSCLSNVEVSIVRVLPEVTSLLSSNRKKRT